MRESLWAWPTATVVHLVGIAALIGLRVLIDLRLIGLRWPFGGVSLPTLARRATPWTVAAALVAFASGAALYAGDPTSLATNPMFQTKIAVLALVLVNIWYCHAFVIRDAAQRDSLEAPAPAARASGFLSLAAWILLLATSLIVPYTPD